jgi:crotonobetainyl-CoA:carnitine CoA-transferase CaiB-like acyl-CoA transferase
MVPSVANPIRLSDSPITYRHSAPMLGEHTNIILRERLGYSPESITKLFKGGVI